MRTALGRLAHRLFPALSRSLLNARILAYGQGQRRNEAVDAAGKPIPWLTYPAIEYLAQFDLRRASIFEFGAGNSSLYWAERATRVCSVESSPEWHAKIAARGAPNLELFLRENKAAYVGCLAERGGAFDLIVVDGRWRESCARAAVAGLRAEGLIVLDDSQRYPHTTRELRESGFFQVDFSGFGPLNYWAWTTSVFVRGGAKLQQGFADPRPIGGVREDVEEDG